MLKLSSLLIDWYKINQRDLPWRNTNNPYSIWLSEIILQQTRVQQGLPYYLKFIQKYPTLKSLANASQDEVLALWQGLGYYSRARNLHATAKFISVELGGFFPTKYIELLKLKGVGEYTAAAIASFAYDEDVAVVDGNVFRVLSRYYGLEDDISQPKTKKQFQSLANSILPQGKAAVFNQAIMEFGAIQCIPKSPNCSACIFNSNCFALQKNKVHELPIKTKKNKIKNRYLNYIIVKDNANNFLLEQRNENDIWKNLFQFPLIETPNSITDKKVVELIYEKFDTKNIKIFSEKPILHKLSHQHLNIRFFEIQINNNLQDALPFHEMIKKPFPIVIHNFIKSNYF